MRIISKFQDYYDHVQAYGMSDAIYHRKKVEIEIDDKEFSDYIKTSSTGGTVYFKKFDAIMESHLIGLCDKIYPVITITYTDKNYNTHRTCIYDEETLHQYYIDNKLRDLDDYYQKNYWSKKTPQQRRKEFFNRDLSKLKELFYQYNVPMFVIDLKKSGHSCNSPVLYLNHELKDFKFYTQMDTFKTFQEIEMFVSGVLQTPVQPIITISDECMRDAKGFDKYSFKKMPTKKR